MAFTAIPAITPVNPDKWVAQYSWQGQTLVDEIQRVLENPQDYDLTTRRMLTDALSIIKNSGTSTSSSILIAGLAERSSILWLMSDILVNTAEAVAYCQTR